MSNSKYFFLNLGLFLSIAITSTPSYSTTQSASVAITKPTNESLLKTENEQLKRELANLKNEQTVAIHELKIRNEQLLATVDLLTLKIDSKPNQNELDILSKSVLERLRTTDDSVSMWGITSAWFATLLTAILAAMALLHFGRIKELTSNTKAILDQAKHDNMIAANAAVERAGNQAKLAVDNWIAEAGIKKIENKISTFNGQIEIAKEKLSNIDSSLMVANLSIGSLKEKEKNISQISTEKDNTDLITNLSLTPENKDFDVDISIILGLISNQNYFSALDVIRKLEPKNENEKLKLLILNVYTLNKLNMYGTIYKLYQKNLETFRNENILSSTNTGLNIPASLLCICNSLYMLNRNEELIGYSEFCLDLFLNINTNKLAICGVIYVYNERNKESPSKTLDYIDKFLSSTSIKDNVRSAILKIKVQVETEINPCYSLDKDKLLENVSSMDDLIDLYITLTNHHMIKKEWYKSLDLFEEIDNLLFKEHKKIYQSSYLTLVLNRAYSLFNIGAKNKAYRLAKHLNHCVKTKKIILGDSGRFELNTIIASCQQKEKSLD